ncbi:hypothetical protein [Bradyrhizobium sp. USDA 4451]
MRVLNGSYGDGPQALDIVVTRHDVLDEASFRSTGVLELYEQLFPASERDSSDDVVRWLLSDDVGEPRHFSVGGQQISYRLDSRCFILRAGGRAIGLGFFTYDHASDLIYCNHVGIDRAWRGGLARAFYREMVATLDELFPRNIGVVLEVEPFDRDRLVAIIADLERTGRRQLVEDQQAEIRKLLRVRWYDKLGYAVFCDARTMRPLVCRSPSLNPSSPDPSSLDPCLPSSDRAGGEENYWLMWQPRTGAPKQRCAPISSGKMPSPRSMSRSWQSPSSMTIRVDAATIGTMRPGWSPGRCNRPRRPTCVSHAASPTRTAPCCRAGGVLRSTCRSRTGRQSSMK